MRAISSCRQIPRISGRHGCQSMPPSTCGPLAGARGHAQRASRAGRLAPPAAPPPARQRARRRQGGRSAGPEYAHSALKAYIRHGGDSCMVTDACPSAGEYAPGGQWRPDLPDAGRRILRWARDDPDAALSLLRATVGAWDDGRLAGLSAGRREVICALVEIARAPENFEEAARILLRLAATEGGSAPNGARGVFARLFANVPPP